MNAMSSNLSSNEIGQPGNNKFPSFYARPLIKGEDYETEDEDEADSEEGDFDDDLDNDSSMTSEDPDFPSFEHIREFLTNYDGYVQSILFFRFFN